MLSMSLLLVLIIAFGIFYVCWHGISVRKEHSNVVPKQDHKLSQPVVPGHGILEQSEDVKPIHQPWEYFLVLDVEATCLAGTDYNWPNEIIEWPVVLLTWNDRDDDGRASQLKVVDEFRSFVGIIPVRPTWKPKLTEFCVTLTGITQTDVDDAPIFSKVLENFRRFLCRHGLICSKTGQRLRKFTWATDGPCDVRDFVVKQCFISKMKMPEWLRGDVIDVRKQVAAWLPHDQRALCNKRSRRWSPGRSLTISRQLTALSLPPFQGRQHSGIDDTRNIARILVELARRGVRLEPNLRIHPEKRWYWMGNQLGEIYNEYFSEYNPSN